ncbi:hypothetical protein IEO21_04993 [Rhodonia placenta]|uniref:CCR4-NOT transcription complex subunit 11 n=1 Tax=Rhodonia placenta TaxID=104341 RepID=A0A8H7P2Q2_9APHY|nr:hypothetical protein IEO21_04993 [Postia placenta]
MKQSAANPAKASVSHLLSRALSLPCSTAAQAFTQLVQPTSRFQVALDVLLPLLDSIVEPAQRILVAYLLYSLYAPHPMSINPFQSVLFSTFVKERDLAIQMANDGGVSQGEQLVWVLYKILKGDGSDLGPFSPATLARSPLPPKLRAAYLFLEEERPRAGDYKFDPFGTGDADTPLEDRMTQERDQEAQRLSDGMALLLAARERVLTLSEQRVLLPTLPQLTNPPVITSIDLPSLIMNNPTLAQPLLAGLLSSAPSTGQHSSLYLEVLKHLPPTLASFDLIGRLLRDTTLVPDVTTGGKTTIADLVRIEVLGWFIHDCIAWLEDAERQEREGNISDDRFAKGVQNLCRFYNALIRNGLVDPASDADSAEMAHFTLRNARFEEANALYRVLAMGKF